MAFYEPTSKQKAPREDMKVRGGLGPMFDSSEDPCATFSNP